MKLVYMLTLILGIMMAFIMQLVTIALPPDAGVAYTLARSPDHWSIRLDDDLAARLASRDVKAELITALEKRALFRTDIYKRFFREGVVLIALSFLGLLRERKIRELRETVRASVHVPAKADS